MGERNLKGSVDNIYQHLLWEAGNISIFFWGHILWGEKYLLFLKTDDMASLNKTFPARMQKLRETDLGRQCFSSRKQKYFHIDENRNCVSKKILEIAFWHTKVFYCNVFFYSSLSILGEPPEFPFTNLDQ